MTEKQQKIIRNFIDGDKGLYKEFEKIKSIITKEDVDPYSLFIMAYFNDDNTNYMKYNSIIRRMS